jgi:hypothetical protein
MLLTDGRQVKDWLLGLSLLGLEDTAHLANCREIVDGVNFWPSPYGEKQTGRTFFVSACLFNE